MVRLAQSMCVAGFGQTIERDLRRPYRPRLKQLGDAIEMPARASDRRPQRRYVVAIRLWRLAAGRDKGGAAARFEDREGPLRNITADGIEGGPVLSGPAFFPVPRFCRRDRPSCGHLRHGDRAGTY